MAESQLLNSIFKVIQDFEAAQQEKLQTTEETIRRLEHENSQLRQELDKGTSILDDVTDETLKKRLANLGAAPLDTLIREAGVVLEDRLRHIAGASGASLHGVALVDAVLSADKGNLIFSEHSGEQQGILMLYRGAMQFIRNPPMHNLIEYQASRAQLLIRLVDSLLRLLAEADAQQADAQVKLEDVRRMLTRIPIPNGQRQLYQALQNSGDKGLSSSELASALNRTRYQLAGVLGALGVRINGTEGLENKGGVTIILDIHRLDNGDYLYRMRPILRKALEIEKVI
jgi:hypothetical protein